MDNKRVIKILLVDDDPDDRLIMKELLSDVHKESVQYEVKESSGINDGFEIIKNWNADILLLDLTLPETTGVETIKAAIQAGVHIPIVVLTGLEDEATSIEALRIGAQDYLVKGKIDPNLLTRCILYAIERYQISKKLHETTVSKDYMDNILNSMADLLIVVKEDGTIEKINPATLRLLKYEEKQIIGKSIETILDGQWTNEKNVCLLNKERNFKTKRGDKVSVLFSCSPLSGSEDGDEQRFVCIAQDISERQKLEKMVAQSEKMSSLGELAAGVAHDFNNLLTSILMNAEFLAEDLEPSDTKLEDIGEIKKAGKGAADLCRELLAFGRRQVLNSKILDLNEIVLDVEKILKRTIGEKTELVTKYGKDLATIKADSSQLEQIIMNLVVNARDAMPQGGKIIVETSNVVLHEPYIHEQFTVDKGSYVMFTVSDVGCGMTKEQMKRIFEPFFTTKDKGKGTGLGLSTVYGIIKQTGGYIWVYSEIGKGTTFKIFFKQAGEKKEIKEEKPLDRSDLEGHETILLVEDEAPIREVAKRVLSGHGYKVLEASQGEEALAISKAYHSPIHMILSDVVMPGLSGNEMVTEMEYHMPDSKVLFMSGYPVEVIGHHENTEENMELIAKPFVPQQLLQRVRAVLDKGSPIKEFNEIGMKS